MARGVGAHEHGALGLIMAAEKNTPDAGGNQRGGDITSTPNQEHEVNTHIIADPGHKYHGWVVRIGPDYDEAPIITEDALGRGLMRVHCLATRIPSKREFVIRPFAGATPDERAQDLAFAGRIHRDFDRAECAGAVGRVLNRESRYWVYVTWPGTPIEDPLIQLELEMMIDLENVVPA